MNLTRITGIYKTTNIHLRSNLAQFCLEWQMLPTKVAEQIKTHILCSITLFSENHAVYEIMWKNIGHTWHNGACALHAGYPKATSTHSEYEVLIAVALQQWLHERATMLRHTRTYNACLVSFTDRKVGQKKQNTKNLEFCPREAESVETPPSCGEQEDSGLHSHQEAH